MRACVCVCVHLLYIVCTYHDEVLVRLVSDIVCREHALLKKWKHGCVSTCWMC